MRGQAQPRFSPEGTCGRLAELYLLCLDLPGAAEKALIYAQAGLKQCAEGSPFVPKLRHFEAMAMRLAPQADEAAFAASADKDRASIAACYDTMPKDAFVFAQGWGDWAWERKRWTEAAEAFGWATRTLRQILRRHVPDEKTRLDWLQQSSCVTRGAFALAEADRLEDAVLLLERANHFFYAAQADGQALERLALVNPALAASVQELLGSALGDAARFDSVGRLSETESARQAQLDAAVKQIRLVPGFAGFATEPGWDAIREAATQTPLLYLFATPYGAKAFLVGNALAGGLHIVSIPFEITSEDLNAAMLPFIEAEYGTPRRDSRAELAQWLEWLGEEIMAHVRGALGDLRGEDERLVLIPVGLTALLPLHAALVRPEPERIHFLLHPRNVSYAISAQSLVQSRRQPPLPADPQVVMINNPVPLPVNYDPLLLSDAEAQTVQHWFPSARLLSGRHATTAQVMQALLGAHLIHFSCHGTLDSRFGYASVLLLAERQLLTQQHLRGLHLRARLVVLSACATGIISLHSEQTLTLPGQFLAAGAGVVLSTLWHSDELATCLLIWKFYEIWNRDAVSPLAALGDAQAWLIRASAASLRADLLPEVLDSPAATTLREAADDALVFTDPWYWANLFIAGL